MKKLITIISLILISFLCMGQETKNVQQVQKKANHSYDIESKQSFFIPNPDTLVLINVTADADTANNGWALLGEPCAGCASYFYKILRSKDRILAEDGYLYYYFYLYFYSNSYLENRDIAGTYLSDVNIYIGNQIAVTIPYILIEPSKIIYAAWVRTGNPYSQIYFQPAKVTVY